MNREHQPSTRLRKFIRQPERHVERYGAFHLTGRDLDVLELVFRYRHVTADHIRALTPGSDQRLGRRLAGLFHHGYLARYAPLDRMRFELNAGSPVMAYGLDTKGWRTLEQEGRVPANVHAEGENTEASDVMTWRKAYTRRTAYFLKHHLGISNFRCVLELALRDEPNGLLLEEWDQSAGIRGEVTLADKSILRVNPDAFFAIRDGEGGLRNYFLEFDAGSEEQRRREAKLLAYWMVLQGKAYREAHEDHQRVAVLFVTTGQKRMENMMETLARMQKPNNPPYGGKGWFRFCLETDYQLAEPGSILSPIWQTVMRREDKISLP